jgi:serine/threonine protein kinase
MAPEIFKKTGHGKPVDIWAIGVITYFLLCGYTPFDRDSNLEEMQAILVADYSFTPVEFWRGVSDHARDFIRRCLTIDATQRMTAHQALQHPFVSGEPGKDGDRKGNDLLPTVKKNFNARRTLHAAIDAVRAINKLREGQNQNGMMQGMQSGEPARGAPALSSAIAAAAAAASNGANSQDSGYGTLAEGGGTNSSSGGSAAVDPPSRGETKDADGDVKMRGVERLSGQGQTEAQIEAQVRKIADTTRGLWQGKR